MKQCIQDVRQLLKKKYTICSKILQLIKFIYLKKQIFKKNTVYIFALSKMHFINYTIKIYSINR